MLCPFQYTSPTSESMHPMTIISPSFSLAHSHTHPPTLRHAHTFMDARTHTHTHTHNFLTTKSAGACVSVCECVSSTDDTRLSVTIPYLCFSLRGRNCSRSVKKYITCCTSNQFISQERAKWGEKRRYSNLFDHFR